jgi:hypothetical protein
MDPIDWLMADALDSSPTDTPEQVEGPMQGFAILRQSRPTVALLALHGPEQGAQLTSVSASLDAPHVWRSEHANRSGTPKAA